MNPLEETAAAVEAAYRRRRQMFHPEWRPTDRWRQFWMRIADTLARAGVSDVSGYVEAQFELVKPFPQPNMLHSQTALRRYLDWAASRAAGRETEWELQVHCELNHILSRRNIHGSDHDDRTLLDPLSPLSPLCRVACLLRLDWPPNLIPAGWRTDAARLAGLPAALEAYRKWKIVDDAILERVLHAPGS